MSPLPPCGTSTPPAMQRKPESTYSDPSFWQNSSLTPVEEERITATVGLIPSDVQSVLDVGCGDGRVSRHLQEKCSVISVDLSEAALRAAGGNGVRASACRLPFPDQSSDLVCCTEVLEHLEDEDYSAALSELIRVSARYVLLSVPAEEDLFNDSTRCSCCGRPYHIWGHQRPFGAAQLKELRPELRLREMRHCGELRRRLRVTRWIRRYVGRQWPVNKYAVCPNCGCRSEERMRKNLITYACAVIDRIVHLPSVPRWTICLYDRN